MATELAARLDAIPLVATTAERGTKFPTPSTGQRVQNLETGAIERYTGTAWVAVPALGGMVSPLDYGAVGDDSTNDATALADAITAALASGATLHIPSGYTFRCTAWTAVTTTAELRLVGGGTIKYTGSSQVAFLKCPYNLTMDGVTFDGWFRVVENDTGVVTTAVDWVRITNCRFLNADTGASNFAYQLLIQNPCQHVVIERCLFENGLYTAFQIGDNVYADQDDWERVTIRDNVIDGISMQGTTAGIAYGFLVYGRDVTIDGNTVTNVNGPTGASASNSNGASGIYTKARYNQITNNRVTSIGTTTAATVDDPTTINGIHIKGSDRSVTSSPQGFDVVCSGNVVRNIGVSNTRGEGIAALHCDTLIANNIVEESGLYGIVFADQTGGATGSTVITGNTVLHASGASYRGIDVVPSDTSRTVVSANVLKVTNTAIAVRNTTVAGAGGNVAVTSNVINTTGVAVQLTADTTSMTNCLVANNLVEAATYGVYFTVTSGGTHSDHMVTDNDFSAASTAAISGTGGSIPATTRIRNNRGYVSENGGTSAGITTGGTIAHGCAATPTVFSAVPTATATDVYVTAGATNLTVTFGGGGTVAFAWEAKTANHYA